MKLRIIFILSNKVFFNSFSYKSHNSSSCGLLVVGGGAITRPLRRWMTNLRGTMEWREIALLWGSKYKIMEACVLTSEVLKLLLANFASVPHLPSCSWKMVHYECMLFITTAWYLNLKGLSHWFFLPLQKKSPPGWTAESSQVAKTD